MTILLAQDWDVITGMKDEYETFITDTYLPGTIKLGLESIGGFYVVVGFGPKIVSLKKTGTLNELIDIMSTPEFKLLHSQLREFVVNYSSRIMEPTGNVKHSEYRIQKGVWKLNQYYDLMPGRKKDYAQFILNEYLPTMKKIDYVEVTGGWNLLVGGFCEIIGELTFQSPVDIGRLFENEDFRTLTRTLQREYVINFNTRIMRTTERFEASRWYRL